MFTLVRIIFQWIKHGLHPSLIKGLNSRLNKTGLDHFSHRVQIIMIDSNGAEVKVVGHVHNNIQASVDGVPLVLYFVCRLFHCY